jgi:pyruvate/2-oxoglutarate dehydrogenase complex dihydrolipoamide acyltransferase (E2) component
MSRIEIRIEDAGDFDEVEVVEVFVEVGAEVTQGQPILELATDKANQEIEAPEDGTITEILVEQDEIISPDRVLAVLETAS